MRAFPGGGRRRAPPIPAAALALAALSAACVPMPPIVSGPPLPKEKVEAIRPGGTTRAELLASLGPPSAVFARGRREPVARPVTVGATGFVATPLSPLLGSEAGDGEAAWATFEERGTAGGDDRVYYYRRTSSWKLGVFLLLAIWERGWTSSDRLWVLVDERKGVVKDLYAYP